MKPTVSPGTVGEFGKPDDLLAAARDAYANGYRRLDAYTPFPVEGLASAIGMRRTGVPSITLAGGLFGACLGYGMQYYSAAVAYPLNVGGRPLHSWPAFVPVSFELMVLCAALSAAVGMLVLNRLPQLHHPIFSTPFFEERNSEHFYLLIAADDPLFDTAAVRTFLTDHRATGIWDLAL